MRASHLVLGLVPTRTLRRVRLAASFHQFPSHDRRGLRGRVEDVLVKRATRAAALLTSPSARAVEELQTQGYVQRGEAVFEPNVIQLTSEGAPALRAGGAPLRLLFAGRLSEQKGLDRIPALLNSTREAVHLRIAGDGETGDAIRSLLADIPSHHRVELLGHRTNIQELIDWSDALFLPSRWELNPVIVWEGWARGKATLGWDIAALRDLKAHGPIWLIDGAEGFSEGVEQITRLDTRRAARDEALASTFERAPSRIVRFLND